MSDILTKHTAGTISLLHEATERTVLQMAKDCPPGQRIEIILFSGERPFSEGVHYIENETLEEELDWQNRLNTMLSFTRAGF